MSELRINDLILSPDVVSSVVCLAVKKVPGVAVVTQDMFTSGLLSMFSSAPQFKGLRVEAEVSNDKLSLVVHTAVFFGYQFNELAQAIRQAVVKAVQEHIGLDVARVDVCIDSLVFPKE